MPPQLLNDYCVKFSHLKELEQKADGFRDIRGMGRLSKHVKLEQLEQVNKEGKCQMYLNC